ncbi:sigma-70 family RNA polymerase sigma factor [Candidatus Uabimicrobium sp. HlEnr_7]|uniref:sigma-70 family RNA polymerase sigma factor n=1 Tax=Candidatus Uabimicrobium helgolandensis TaxID=3095367 RepID=UPI0035580965
MGKKFLDDDTLLVTKSKQGDKSAFDVLVIKYQDRVFNVVFRLTSDESLAYDLVQDTFINAYRGLKNFKGHSTFFTWLFRIAINTATNSRRKRMRNKTISISKFEGKNDEGWFDPASNDKGPSQKAEEVEQTVIVQQAINSLEEPYKTAIILRDIEGMSYEEMQEILECPIGTVRSRIHRARNLVKEKLEATLNNFG